MGLHHGGVCGFISVTWTKYARFRRELVFLWVMNDRQRAACPLKVIPLPFGDGVPLPP